MTFAEVQQQIKDASAQYQAGLESDLSRIYADAGDKVEAIRDRYYRTYCAGAKDGNEMFAALNAYGRLEKMQSEIQAVLDAADAETMDTIRDYSSKVMMSNYYAEQFAITAFAGAAGYTNKFSMLDENVIEYALKGQTESWKAMSKSIQDRMTQSAYYPREGTLSDLMAKHSYSSIANVQQIIASTFLSGLGPDAAARMVKDQFGRIDGNAQKVAQTEILFMSNCGDYASYQQAAANGVEMQKQWMALFLSAGRNRPTHAALDGKRVPVDGYFNAGGEKALMPHMFATAENNAFCHCTTISVIKGMEDNFDSVVDPVTGRDGTFSWANFDTYLKQNGLNPEEVNAYIFRDKTKR